MLKDLAASEPSSSEDGTRVDAMVEASAAGSEAAEQQQAEIMELKDQLEELLSEATEEKVQTRDGCRQGSFH